jgi:diketogulonate reductase-like aldo/keto reductase
LNQQALLDYCTPRQIKVIAYRPFGKGKIFADEPSIDLMGAKHHKTGAQIILRWLIQKEVAVIPKASSIKHMKENLEIFDFFLTKSEMAELDGLNQNKRYCKIENLEYTARE